MWKTEDYVFIMGGGCKETYRRINACLCVHQCLDVNSEAAHHGAARVTWVLRWMCKLWETLTSAACSSLAEASVWEEASAACGYKVGGCSGLWRKTEGGVSAADLSWNLS